MYAFGAQPLKYEVTSMVFASASDITPVTRADKSAAVPFVCIVLNSLNPAFSGLFPLMSVQPAATIKSPAILVFKKVTCALAPHGLPKYPGVTVSSSFAVITQFLNRYPFSVAAVGLWAVIYPPTELVLYPYHFNSQPSNTQSPSPKI